MASTHILTLCSVLAGKVEDPQTLLVTPKDMSPTQPNTLNNIDTDLASQVSLRPEHVPGCM